MEVEAERRGRGSYWGSNRGYWEEDKEEENQWCQWDSLPECLGARGRHQGVNLNRGRHQQQCWWRLEVC